MATLQVTRHLCPDCADIWRCRRQWACSHCTHPPVLRCPRCWGERNHELFQDEDAGLELRPEVVARLRRPLDRSRLLTLEEMRAKYEEDSDG